MTWDGTTQRLYVNGVQVGTQAVGGTLVNSAGALRFGGNNVWSEWFSGALDEIRIYDRALSQAEVQSDMTTPVTCSGTPPPQPALSVSRTTMAFTATQGGAEPGRADVRHHEHRRRHAQLHRERVRLVAHRRTGERQRPGRSHRHGLDRRPRARHLHGAGHVTAAGATGSPKTIDVTLTVNAAQPVLSVTPGSLSFSATAGGANPAAQTLSVTNTGGGTLNCTASDDQPWLAVTPRRRHRAGLAVGHRQRERPRRGHLHRHRHRHGRRAHRDRRRRSP